MIRACLFRLLPVDQKGIIIPVWLPTDISIASYCMQWWHRHPTNRFLARVRHLCFFTGHTTYFSMGCIAYLTMSWTVHSNWNPVWTVPYQPNICKSTANIQLPRETDLKQNGHCYVLLVILMKNHDCAPAANPKMVKFHPVRQCQLQYKCHIGDVSLMKNEQCWSCFRAFRFNNW